MIDITLPPVTELRTYQRGAITIIEHTEVPEGVTLVLGKRHYQVLALMQIQMKTPQGIQMHNHNFQYPLTDEVTSIHHAFDLAEKIGPKMAEKELSKLRMQAMSQGLGG